MTFCSSMYKPLERVIVKHPKEAFISQEHLSQTWENFNFLEEPDFNEALTEYGDFISILEKYVPNIDYLPASSVVGIDSLYASSQIH